MKAHLRVAEINPTSWAGKIPVPPKNRFLIYRARR
jgi:hypothetical protein